MAAEFVPLRTRDIRHSAPYLEPTILFSAKIYDYASRRVCMSRDYHIDHLIELKCFTEAYNECNDKELNKLVLRLIANSPDNVAKVSGWIDSEKERGAMFTSVVGTYINMNRDMVGRTLLRVRKAFGERYFLLLLKQISVRMKLDFSYESPGNIVLTAHFDMEHFLGFMFLMVTVQAVSILNISSKKGICCFPIEDRVRDMYLNEAFGFRALQHENYRNLFDAVCAHNRGLVRTLGSFPVARGGGKAVVLTEKEFRELEKNNKEAVQYDQFLKRLKKLQIYEC